jgi:uncharacterized protein YdbL (DUF1318 family)
MKTIVKRLKKIAFSTALVFAIASCVTINIYFPAAAVEKAADKIVEEVWGDKTPAGPQAPAAPTAPASSGGAGIENPFKYASLMFGPAPAFAAEEADINVTTPAIRALKDAIQGRADGIKPFLDKGSVGISNDGMLVARSEEGLNLKEKADLKRLLTSENKDREALYAEIAKANNFSPDKIGDIKKLFAKSWIKNAKAGWWIQEADGSWHQK